MTPETARVLASILPKPRTPAEEIDPNCCSTCYERWHAEQQRRDRWAVTAPIGDE